MCGIAGFWLSARHRGDETLTAAVQRMTDRMVNRGPDDAGHWCDEQIGVGLGHRRLAIVDLSPAGHQPMASMSGRFVIVFNGEIYNHVELRSELDALVPGLQWRGHSDTETLLQGFQCWGIRKTVEKATGMFAFAVWDREERTLTLARDRLGEKPLYYGWQNGAFLFGSELSALKAHPAFSASIDRNALALLLRHNYIPAPYSIYEGISKLPPGTIACLRSVEETTLEISPYWSVEQAWLQGKATPFSGTAEQAVDRLDSLLCAAVQRQMLADVPLGAFLSGGVDSSTIVAVMQRLSSKPVKTFSIGFHEKGYNEAEHAKAVASHLGTEHTELYVSASEMLSVVPKLSQIYSEPFSDSSQIPTCLVSAMARRDVTVSLSGDAGDELFGGYSRYQQVSRLWGRLSRIPAPLRSMCATLLTSVPAEWMNVLGKPLAVMMSKHGRQIQVGDKAHKAAEVLASRDFITLYKGFMSHSKAPASLLIGAEEPPTAFSNAGRFLRPFSPHDQMMAMDMLSYLPDDILAKVDRAAMAASLETRVPLLDHAIVEFACALPLKYKIHNGQSKWVLKQLLYRHVPRELIERPKMGFGVPMNEWLRGPLKAWAGDLLSTERLRAQGFFRPELVSTYWREHQTGARNWGFHLWDILMFQSWLEAQ